jgi:hypothetical protein
MIVSIKHPDDLSKLSHVAKKKNILARFVMNGCHWCKDTQHEWDAMTKKAVLKPDDAIAEIESSFIDQFKYMIEPKRKILLPISGFPTVIMIKSNGVIKHEGDRTSTSYLKLLKSKSKRKLKRKKTKKITD